MFPDFAFYWTAGKVELASICYHYVTQLIVRKQLSMRDIWHMFVVVHRYVTVLIDTKCFSYALLPFRWRSYLTVINKKTANVSAPVLRSNDLRVSAKKNFFLQRFNNANLGQWRVLIPLTANNRKSRVCIEKLTFEAHEKRPQTRWGSLWDECDLCV